ncbi:hypothetical protein [uncultured Clostridium sp.]|uniref:hypothetical protein n=1 Tax=uncultured Clostridium sp. TaxID=59620 RepID=UPI0025E5DA0D|nr:hypothetical protein [uncultured Clostridium sp.]
MDRLEKMKNKNIGIYIRKQKVNENLSTGYGRLQWLKYYELKDHKGRINVYVDEPYKSNRFNRIIKDIEDRKIDAIIIWDKREFEKIEFLRIINMCVFSQVEIISFFQKMYSIEQITEIYPLK